MVDRFLDELREIITHYDPHTSADLRGWGGGGGGVRRKRFSSPQTGADLGGLEVEALISGIRPPADPKGPPLILFKKSILSRPTLKFF